ncbi:hypothetical protein Q7P36_005914 [Cladosporium allicinum]
MAHQRRYLEFVDRLHHGLASAQSNLAKEAVLRKSCQKILEHEENVLVWASALQEVVKASQSWGISLDSIPQLNELTKLTSHEDETRLSSATRKRRALAVLVAFWSHDRVSYYNFHAYPLRSLGKLVKIATTYPDWHDFARRMNVSLLARHERSITDAKCSRIGLHHSRSNVHAGESPLESIDIEHATHALSEDDDNDTERRLHMWLHPCQCLLRKTGMTQAQAKFYMIGYDLHDLLVPEKDRPLGRCAECSVDSPIPQREDSVLSPGTPCEASAGVVSIRAALPYIPDPDTPDFSMQSADVIAFRDLGRTHVSTAPSLNGTTDTGGVTIGWPDINADDWDLSDDVEMDRNSLGDASGQDQTGSPKFQDFTDWSWPVEIQNESSPLIVSSLSPTTSLSPFTTMYNLHPSSDDTLQTQGNSQDVSYQFSTDASGQQWFCLDTSSSSSHHHQLPTLPHFPSANSTRTFPEQLQDETIPATSHVSIVDIDIALSATEPFVDMSSPVEIRSKFSPEVFTDLATYIASMRSMYQGLSVKIHQDRRQNTWTPIEAVIEHLNQEVFQPTRSSSVWYMESISRTPPPFFRRLPQFKLLERLIQRRKSRLSGRGEIMSYLSLSDIQNHLTTDVVRPKGSYQEARLETLGHRWITCLFGRCTFHLVSQPAGDGAAFQTNIDVQEIQGRGQDVVLGPGEVILIPIMTMYSVTAHESCVTEEGTFWDDKTVYDILAALSSGLDCQDEGYQHHLRLEVPHIVEEFFTIDRQDWT